MPHIDQPLHLPPTQATCWEPLRMIADHTTPSVAFLPLCLRCTPLTGKHQAHRTEAAASTEYRRAHCPPARPLMHGCCCSSLRFVRIVLCCVSPGMGMGGGPCSPSLSLVTSNDQKERVGFRQDAGWCCRRPTLVIRGLFIHRLSLSSEPIYRGHRRVFHRL